MHMIFRIHVSIFCCSQFLECECQASTKDGVDNIGNRINATQQGRLQRKERPHKKQRKEKVTCSTLPRITDPLEPRNCKRLSPTQIRVGRGIRKVQTTRAAQDPLRILRSPWRKQTNRKYFFQNMGCQRSNSTVVLW